MHMQSKAAVPSKLQKSGANKPKSKPARAVFLLPWLYVTGAPLIAEISSKPIKADSSNTDAPSAGDRHLLSPQPRGILYYGV